MSDDIISFNTDEQVKKQLGVPEYELYQLVPEKHPILKEVMPEYDFNNQKIGDIQTAADEARCWRERFPQTRQTRLRLQAHQGYETLKSFDRIDPHYLQLWLDFIYGNMYTRGILDDRTRLLMMVGICLAANEPVQLENHLRGSLMQGATPREVLEVILQSTVYVGYVRAGRGAKICIRVMKDLGRLEEITSTQLPLDGANGKRRLEDERPQWPPAESPEVAAESGNESPVARSGSATATPADQTVNPERPVIPAEPD